MGGLDLCCCDSGGLDWFAVIYFAGCLCLELCTCSLLRGWYNIGSCGFSGFWLVIDLFGGWLTWVCAALLRAF